MSLELVEGRIEGNCFIWYVYILECKNKLLYTGVTNNIERRYKEHLKKTSHYTGYNTPSKVLFTESFPTKIQALKREKQIKGWTRRKKLALIADNLELLKKL